MSITLDQQTGAGGGGFTSRGAGETKLEQSRRRITKQMVHIRQELADIEKSEGTRSAQRQHNQLPNVALVGYTNAGKSTIMNQLLHRFGVGATSGTTKQVFEKDMLFATLNTTVRQLTLPDKHQFLLSDTVGFVSKLPHNLIEAFKSTLSEAANADLLLNIVDISDENYQDMIHTTQETLAQIGVSGRPMITVFNKADKAGLPFPEITGDNTITISALDTTSQDVLIDLIKKHIFKNDVVVKLHIPFTQGNIQAKLAANHTFISENFDESGTIIEVALSPDEAHLYAPFII
ncbi:MAG: GTPase HflX, partial [Leuconostoc fallax]